MNVRAWKEKVLLPTYGYGLPEKNPMFLEKRVYQGSSGVVYPYPVVEKITDDRIMKEWNAIFLENDYLKIMILPELGGRIQMAYDKTKERHFVYYNQVIKPALVGLTGLWISGGIEFNWPQHHRPSTFLPVDSYIDEMEDGSITVWCSEVERMFRTRGMTGFTLYKDKSYLEVKVKIFNRTNHSQTFLWWANPAVKVNEYYQSVFPPDVHAVFDHGKRDVSEFPIAKGSYYKVDYSPGTDISQYKNIPVPTSYMAISSKYDFIGGYEHDTKSGLLHVANHHISPGKKQWTWGNGDFGNAWNRNLTDEDGPYIEIMCGVYTDNQPDFSWLSPGEEKTFSQYFMPYRDVGLVKNASKEAILNFEIEEDFGLIKIYTTATYISSKIELFVGQDLLFSDTFDFSPKLSYEKTVLLPQDVNCENLYLVIKTENGKILIDWHPDPNNEKELPNIAKAALDPAFIESNEQLYLTGLHLEQYRHATYDPRIYYEEALKRDEKDSRCNNALGLWYLRRGQFIKSEYYFRRAISTLVERNPNPKDGEPFYNLGMSLLYQGFHDKAYDAFYKSIWNASWQDAGLFQLARLEMRKEKWDEAMELIDRSLLRNNLNHRARHIKVILLRKLKRSIELKEYISKSLELDKFNFGVLFEKVIIAGFTETAKQELNTLIRSNIHNYIEFSLDYAYAGLFGEAIQFLNIGLNAQDASTYPMALYYYSWYLFNNGEEEVADLLLKEAADLPPDYCFPNQIEAQNVLYWACKRNPKDFKAWYYLGNYWYDGRNYEEAIRCWENSKKLNDRFPTTRRNLALAYFNKLHDIPKALNDLESAFMLDDTDARVLFELDQLHKRMNYEPSRRLERLEKYSDLVDQRDDLYLERLTLYNILGDHQKAYDLIMERKFHPWEGGEGKVAGQYVLSLIELAKYSFSSEDYLKAIRLLEKAKIYPENLGEGKLFGKHENDIDFWLGLSYERLGEIEKANGYWEKASFGLKEPAVAVYYNDQNPDSILYQGFSLQRLGRNSEAIEKFNMLYDFGERHINDSIQIDYFAVSLPDMLIWDLDINLRNKINCTYLQGLGKMGLGEKEEAKKYLNAVVKMDKSFIGAVIHLKIMELFDSL